MPRAVAKQRHGSRLDERRLATARLVHRRIARPARHRARGERVARELRALARQRRRQDLVAVAATGPTGGGPCGARRAGRSSPPRPRRVAAAARAADRDRPRSGRRSAASGSSPRARPARASARSRPERNARSRNDNSIASRSARMRGPSGSTPLPVWTLVSHRSAYVITYARMCTRSVVGRKPDTRCPVGGECGFTALFGDGIRIPLERSASVHL